jgi:tetratricopeptide (TPR) repeat protein
MTELRSRYYLIVFSWLALLIFFPVSANSQSFARGRITDTIKCLDHPGYSYALYLPSVYTEKSKWPVILIFDPGGRGITAAEVFRKAAEKYGYILACSYNSRNGPLNNNFTSAGYMLNDLSKRFVLDEKRIYAAGFSGGSRFALALASSNSIIAGVIGCGAGLPNDNSLIPSAKSSFIYYGVAGNRDMNLLEMFDLISFFNTRTQVIPYLRTFDGGHQWPSYEIAQEAVEWINIQAMKNKLATLDTGYMSFYSHKITALVNNLLSNGNKYDAARYMRYAIRDFSGSPVAKDMARSLGFLENSREYRDANREWSTIASLEKSRSENFMSSIMKIVSSGSVPDTAAAWWRREIGSLVTIKERGNKPNSEMASRLLNFISILCSEQGTAFYHQERYDVSCFLFEICTWSDSDNMNNYYNLARSLSRSNKKREAIEALNKALEHGFTIRKTVENEPAFDKIRNDEKYKYLLMKMK